MRVLIGDDDTLARASLARILRDLSLGLEVDAVDRATAQAAVKKSAAPQIVLFSAFNALGLDEAALLNVMARHADAAVIVLAPYANAGDIVLAKSLGARAFIHKTLPLKAISAALRLVIAGGDYFPSKDNGSADDSADRSALRKSFKPRQCEILTMLSKGAENAEIAGVLGVSVGTVKGELQRIIERLGAKNRTEAAVTAVRLKIID